jgi:hypothetical protein
MREEHFYLASEKIMTYIPLDLCKDSFLYIINARDATIGIYNEKDFSFTISRTKFSSNFLFEEYHWDTGSPFRTAKPLKEIGPVPAMNEDEKLAFLNKKERELWDDIEETFKQTEAGIS